MRHPAHQSPVDSSQHDRGRKVIQRIADTLGCPVETLLKAARSEVYPNETAELIRLWFKIQDAAARQVLLEQIRKVAGEPSA